MVIKYFEITEELESKAEAKQKEFKHGSLESFLAEQALIKLFEEHKIPYEYHTFKDKKDNTRHGVNVTIDGEKKHIQTECYQKFHLKAALHAATFQSPIHYIACFKHKDGRLELWGFEELKKSNFEYSATGLGNSGIPTYYKDLNKLKQLEDFIQKIDRS